MLQQLVERNRAYFDVQHGMIHCPTFVDKELQHLFKKCSTTVELCTTGLRRTIKSNILTGDLFEKQYSLY